MYSDSVLAAAEIGKKKIDFLSSNWIGYFVAAILAGIFIGFGIILIFAVGAPFASQDSPAVKLIMGLSFGIALTLVVFAGSELFTGNTMYMTIGLFKNKVKLSGFIKVLVFSWVGNLVGSLIIAFLAVYGGSIDHAMELFAKVTEIKMHSPFVELFIRAILCNMLVCLALWTSGRAKSEAAKILLIFWCLFAFIGAGFEHSIANMTLLAVGILGNPEIIELSWSGYLNNMLWVTSGNLVGGAIFIAGAYLLTTLKLKRKISLK